MNTNTTQLLQKLKDKRLEIYGDYEEYSYTTQEHKAIIEALTLKGKEEESDEEIHKIELEAAKNYAEKHAWSQGEFNNLASGYYQGRKALRAELLPQIQILQRDNKEKEALMEEMAAKLEMVIHHAFDPKETAEVNAILTKYKSV